jgi:V/A-type H+/Na+-transporting ATPase subunit D
MLKIQYNKTFIQQLRRQLQIRERALPTLKSKETALRVEVKNIATKISNLQEQLRDMRDSMSSYEVLWAEFPEIVKLGEVVLARKNIAGVKVPRIEQLTVEFTEPQLFLQPAWLLMGLESLKKLVRLEAEIEVAQRQYEVLQYARKKTTQKVNLYEKVQIPEFKEGILKVKRYLEDEENLSKSAQKIVKERNRIREAAL